MNTKKLPQKTIARAFVYLRALEALIADGQKCVSSSELARNTGFTDVQIRKDISVFGKVGRPRIGYDTEKLKKLLEDYVAQNVVHVALFGVGNLGSAILKYPRFREDKVKFVAAFDNDLEKVEKTINGIAVYDINQAKEIISGNHVEIGVIATPKQFSQKTADLIVECSIKGIINFSPVNISVPQGVSVKNIDLAVEFLALFCDMTAQENGHA